MDIKINTTVFLKEAKNVLQELAENFPKPILAPENTVANQARKATIGFLFVEKYIAPCPSMNGFILTKKGLELFNVTIESDIMDLFISGRSVVGISEY